MGTGELDLRSKCWGSRLLSNISIKIAMIFNVKVLQLYIFNMHFPQECAKLDLLVMMLPELSSLPSLDVPDIKVSWSVWDRRTPMLEMKLRAREVSSP